MTGKADHNTSGISRRELLKRVGLAGAAASVPAAMDAPVAAAPAAADLEALAASQALARPPALGALETLTAEESGTLEAIVARLIPTDDTGPGAAEARAARYIDRALGGALASSRDRYRAGLAAVDRYARASKGAPFHRLSAADQDAVLTDMETDAAPDFGPDASPFFELLRAHALQGTFCDPYYGGNADFVGWDLVGYPGLRLAVTSDQQRLDARMTPTRRSAYDHTMFSTRKPARASLDRGGPDLGD